MRIEVHQIQNHSPANLNRDDLGAPKSCIFGGVTRARISSQCLKRSIRRSPEFSDALEEDGGVRTRRLIELIATEAASKGSESENEYREVIKRTFTAGGVGLKAEKKDDAPADTFNILFFLPKSAIKQMGFAAADHKNRNLVREFAEIMLYSAKTPDIALCGRMTEFTAKSDFKMLEGMFTVEAALSAAHAISTHAAITEVDYFTAADDLPGHDAGAAHVNEAMFNSACFYKHFVIDFEQLKKNLDDAELACKTVRSFIHAAAKAVPSGKQHSFAAFNMPDGILIEIKKSGSPVSYTNAFAEPVPERSERGLIGESIFRLGQYAHDLWAGYGIESERFWFSPNLRHRLTFIDKNMKEHQQEQSAVGSSEFGQFDEFVQKIMDKIDKLAQLRRS
jgi:CRISPR system Cascade subunit CasC